MFTCTEAARSQPQADPPAHDAFTRLLSRQPPDTEALWQEARALVRRDTGLLVNDDSTLDKPYARKMELVTRPWSGKHHRVVRGITLSTLLWTDGDTLVPTDFRVYDKADGLTKNEHFRAMLGTAHALRVLRLLVLEPGDPQGGARLSVALAHQTQGQSAGESGRVGQCGGLRGRETDRGASGASERLRDERCEAPSGNGLAKTRIRVLRTVAPDGDVEHWATDDRQMSEAAREGLAVQCWGIEQ